MKRLLITVALLALLGGAVAYAQAESVFLLESTLYRETIDVNGLKTYTVVSTEHHFMENNTTGATPEEALNKARAIIAARVTP